MLIAVIGYEFLALIPPNFPQFFFEKTLKSKGAHH